MSPKFNILTNAYSSSNSSQQEIPVENPEQLNDFQRKLAVAFQNVLSVMHEERTDSNLEHKQREQSYLSTIEQVTETNTSLKAELKKTKGELQARVDQVAGLRQRLLIKSKEFDKSEQELRQKMAKAKKQEKAAEKRKHSELRKTEKIIEEKTSRVDELEASLGSEKRKNQGLAQQIEALKKSKQELRQKMAKAKEQEKVAEKRKHSELRRTEKIIEEKTSRVDELEASLASEKRKNENLVQNTEEWEELAEQMRCLSKRKKRKLVLDDDDEYSN